MRFIATYLPTKLPRDRLYRTLWADDVNEAMRIAEKWCRKNYILEKVEQQI